MDLNLPCALKTVVKLITKSNNLTRIFIFKFARGTNLQALDIAATTASNIVTIRIAIYADFSALSAKNQPLSRRG